MTFSIVAWDGDARPSPEWGVAVASKFLAVGAVVPWARAGAGAIATQSFANLTYGRDGLDLLASGSGAQNTVKTLTAADDDRDLRQLGVVDAQGRAATFTGSACFDWAGGHAGPGYCCQGNILVGPEAVAEMARTFESTEGELGRRLLAALTAGDEAGGDRRGRQSAALIVVRDKGGYGGVIDRAVDIRVDDHESPVPELARLFDLHRLYFPRPEDLDFVTIDDSLAAELRMLLERNGYELGESGPGYDARLRDALYAFVGSENLEERWAEDASVERGVIEHLRGKS
jgi:uncharacterized Ntn-hydrolase superfamily protein